MKIFKIVFLISFACIFCTQLSCKRDNKAYNADIEKQKVEKVIHKSIGWAKTKDINLLYSVIANDSNFIVVNPGDRIVKGFLDFTSAEDFWMNPDFKAVRYEIKDLTINFSQTGDVAWFICMLDDINEWKGQPANWENTRWTGVLEKRNNSWVIVQMHFSFSQN
ncbi:MAG: nuclear transport factor 2 family protein [Bacteroidales bacterium]|nr:nuclear transport factor 2 family protein [Bacteroidales bacterium]